MKLGTGAPEFFCQGQNLKKGTFQFSHTIFAGQTGISEKFYLLICYIGSRSIFRPILTLSNKLRVQNLSLKGVRHFVKVFKLTLP